MKITHERVFEEMIKMCATKCVFWYSKEDCRKHGAEMTIQIYAEIANL